MEELIQTFGINWKLLLIQLANFAVVVFILKRFVYSPISKILKERRGEIERGIQNAKDAEEKLRISGEMREKILSDAKNEAVGIVKRAEEIATKRKEEIVREAAMKSEAIVLDAKRIIREEKAKMEEEAAREARDAVRLGVAKVLGNMKPEDRDKGFIDDAMRELKTLKS